MQYKVEPYPKNLFPTGALYLKTDSLHGCLMELQSYGVSADNSDIYALPGDVPNSIKGFLCVVKGDISTGRERMQCVSRNLFIPEYSALHPAFTKEEIDRVFSTGVHCFHPEIGWAQCTERIELSKYLVRPTERSFFIIRPEMGIDIPESIRSARVASKGVEEDIKQMVGKLVEQKDTVNKPLNPLEKGRLGLYKGLAGIGKSLEKIGIKSSGFQSDTDESPEEINQVRKEPSWFDRLFKKIESDFDNLEERNKSEVNKLLELLDRDPNEGLKYAIPIDDGGSRMTGGGSFSLSRRWFNFSLGSGGGSGSGFGRSVDLGDSANSLRQKYYTLARDYESKGDFERASFIYFNLLKDYHNAAAMLEKGKMFKEAAAIHIKYNRNNKRAAFCYKEAKMYLEAAELYSAEKQHEDAGDMYVLLGERDLAQNEYVNAHVAYLNSNKVFEAGKFALEKMGSVDIARNDFLRGWRSKSKEVECLMGYIESFKPYDEWRSTMNDLRKGEVSEINIESFFRVLQKVKRPEQESNEYLRSMQYELVAQFGKYNSFVVAELKRLNKGDRVISSDIVRYQLKQRK